MILGVWLSIKWSLWYSFSTNKSLLPTVVIQLTGGCLHGLSMPRQHLSGIDNWFFKKKIKKSHLNLFLFFMSLTLVNCLLHLWSPKQLSPPKFNYFNPPLPPMQNSTRNFPIISLRSTLISQITSDDTSLKHEFKNFMVVKFNLWCGIRDFSGRTSTPTTIVLMCSTGKRQDFSDVG